ncbi:alkaline phosphatase [Aliikangiella coralliicola]|uniref:Alkaline phosphatase n=1 Tax=Aliikangiella coralliicola TaxID=2592383 RepID=A0A545UHX1_9GAMM|nr:alkaline phosphatase [Aliikangiella coralliicola]TQV89049.1 alkaline phosphatase [Aliikangiella coralliicola]
MNKLMTSVVAVSAALSLGGCVDDGDDGTNGVNGLNSLVSQTVLAIGDADCRNGGLKIDSGLDDNNNNQLDATEIDDTNLVCNPPITQLSQQEVLNNTNNSWYIDSAQKVELAEESLQEVIKQRGGAKNIILFVGDGMGASTVTAARILDGQNKGMQGEENNLSFDAFPFSGLAKTYNVDAQTPDSAGTMTAMMSGIKTDVGVVGLNEAVVRGDCGSASGIELATALELAEIAGKSTGIISTARITHATPAATYAKSAHRNWEDVSDMKDVTGGCKDIADQLVNFEDNLEARYAGLDVDGIEVVMGGGRRHFLPNDPAANSPDAVSAIEGDRTDNRNLITEWEAKYANGVYVYDQNGFDAIDPESTERVFGLFNESHMQYEADRANDVAGEPSLTEMTEKAIQVLDNNQEGFFLMVESGRIDHGHHAGSAYNALTDTIEFSEAVQKALEMTNPEETLIIVTADHSHVFTIAGYPKRGNPILGKVVAVGKSAPDYSLASDGMPYTTVGYTNGPGFRDLGLETDADVSYGTSVTGRVDLTNVDTTAPGFHQEALVPFKWGETHAGEDVGIYASGPGAHLVSGTNEQSLIFHVMDFAGDLVAKANVVLK